MDFAVKMLMDTGLIAANFIKNHNPAYNPLQDKDVDEISNILNKI